MSSLYIAHFSLNKPPFQITPDLEFFFSGGRRGEVLSALLHVAAHEEGISTLIAEVGSGKTLLARLMISRLHPGICAVYLANPCFSRDEIIVAIGRDLGLVDMQGSIENKLAALQRELLRRHASGQRVLLVIDEAHAMPVESLEEVRLLSNLETGRHKLVNIVLFGQPELDVLLAKPMLRQVQDRIIHRFGLQALRKEESGAYIEHRLRAAGWHGGQLMAPAALARLIDASDGRARRINLLADKALLAAYAHGAARVELAHVKSAIAELPRAQMSAGGWHSYRLRIAFGGAVAAMTVLASVVLGAWSHAPVVAPTPIATALPPVPPVATVATSAPDRLATGDEAQVAGAAVARTQAWLQQENLGGYTIQLAQFDASLNPNRYILSIATQLTPSKVFVSRTTFKSKPNVSIFFGSFRSVREASLAIESLPADLKTNKPWVRSWTNIKSEQTP